MEEDLPRTEIQTKYDYEITREPTLEQINASSRIGLFVGQLVLEQFEFVALMPNITRPSRIDLDFESYLLNTLEDLEVTPLERLAIYYTIDLILAKRSLYEHDEIKEVRVNQQEVAELLWLETTTFLKGKPDSSVLELLEKAEKYYE